MKFFKSMLPITLINAIVLFFITLNLPDLVPTNLNLNMEVTNLASKSIVVWVVMIVGIIPVITSIILLVYWHLVKVNKINSKNLKVVSVLLPILITFFMAIPWLPVLIASQDNLSIGSKVDLPMDFIITFPIGVLVIIISNFIGIIKHNYWFGIRTPWTLANETVWKKTHRFGGYTGVIGGIFICLFSLLGFIFKSFVLSIIGLFIGLLLIAIVPCIYSYIMYKKV